MKHVAEVLSTLQASRFESTPPKPVIKNVDTWADWFKFDLRRGTKEEAEMRRLVTASAQFVMAMRTKAQPYWLSLLGSSGAGKTLLAKRIFRWHRECGLFHDSTDQGKGLVEVVYAREWCWWTGLAELLRSNAGYGQLRDAESAALTVFDEIGADPDKSGHVTTCLAGALCARTNKWTIITSNKSMHDIEHSVDARVASRMTRDGGEVLDVTVEDYCVWMKRK